MAALACIVVGGFATAAGATTAPRPWIGHSVAAPGPSVTSRPEAQATTTNVYATTIDDSGDDWVMPTPDQVATFAGTDSVTNQPEVGITGQYPGLFGSFSLSVDVPGNTHLVAGTTYSAATGASVSISWTVNPTLSNSCFEPALSGGVTVDQVAYGSGEAPLSLAMRFDIVCDFAPGPTYEVFGAAAVDISPTTPGQGYYVFGQAGELTGFGNDNYPVYLGALTQIPLNAPIVGMALTPDGAGYWMVGADGGIFAYGDAGFYGSAGNLVLNAPIVGMAATPDGKGYWLVAADGGIFAYGDAGYYGSTGNLRLNQPVVGMSATPDGKGYWFVAADGGIFAYGDAGFYGSAGALHLNKPVVAMSATPDGKGYWFVAADGGIFAYGDAQFHGSAGNLSLSAPIVGMASAGQGYWFVADDGGIFAYGVPFYGSLGGQGITDVAGMATSRRAV